MASRIQGITVEIGGDTTKLSKALESVNKSIKGTQSGLKDVNKLLKLDPSNTELVVQKQKMLKDAIEATKEKLATLKTAAQQANEQLANGEITQQQYDALQREIVETEQNLRSLQDQAATTNATLAKIDEAGEKLQNIGSSVENVGKKFLPVTAAVTGLGTAAVKTAADFDSEMSKVSAISGATGDDFDQLRAKAREMGAKTKFSASEAASAMEYMAMAGWKTSDMLNGIEGVMNLAAASGEDLATTSDIVTDALTAFGLSAADSGHFADILAAASSNANTNVSMMGETFKYCAPIAGALGFSAEDTAEAIGLMANSGIKASQAGTSLRSIMNNLAGEVTFVGENIGEVTIATSNADGSMRSLNDILEDCRVAFSGLSESEKAANAEALVGKNAMSGFLALMNASQSDIDKLSSAIENCDGASESMAETMQDNLNGQLTILKSQLEELAISFGDILMPTIRKIVSAVQQFVDKLNSMNEGTRETIIKIGLLAASIGPLLIVLGKTISTVGTAMRGFSSLAKGVRLLITHVGSASGVFSKLGVVLGGLSGPVVAVVAVIGTLVAAFMNLWNTNEEFRTAITSIWNDIVSKVKGFFDQLTQRINGLGFDFKDDTEVLKAVWDGFCQVLAPLFEGAFQNIATILGVVLDTLLGLFDVFSNVFSGNWSGAWEAVKGIFSSIWDGVKSIFSTTLTALKSALDVFLGLFGTDWQTVWGSIKSFFETVWSGISSFFSNTVSTIQSVATTVFTAVSSFFTTALTSIQTTFSTIWTAISTAVSSVLNTIHTTVTTVWTAISTAISTVMNTISTTITSVWNGIYNTIKPLLDAFKYLLDTFGGEFEWDRYTVKFHRARGADHNVHIVYGKNLTDFKMEKSIENTITGVHPYWVDNETQAVMELPEKVVMVSRKSVPYQKITVLDCTSAFQERPSEAALREYAQDYIDTTSLTEPEVDIKIDFIQLWNTPGYEDVVQAEQVSLCDTVHVYISKLGIEASSKVTETEYDSLLERYNSITLSNSTVSSRNSSLTSSLNSIRNTATAAYDTAVRVETAVGEQMGGISASIIYDGALFAALFGLHYKNETDSKGNTTRYAFNAATLKQSTVAWKNSPAGFFVSTDGGKTWGYGWESDDSAVKTAILLEQTLKELDDRYKKAAELSKELLEELDERYKTATAISVELQKTLDQRYETAKKLSKELYEELDAKYQPYIPVSESASEDPAEDSFWVDKKNLRLKLWDGEQWQTIGYEPEEPDPEPTEPTTPTEPETPDTEKPGSEDKDTENKEKTDNKETDQEGGSS